MKPEIITALISGLCVAIPSLFATIVSNIVSNISNNKKAEENKNLTIYRLDQLEKKVDKHNSVIERTFRLEEQVKEIQDDVAEIKSRLN